MPDNNSLPKVNQFDIFDEISNFVYQFVVDTQQQQPELLNEKYRKVNWIDERNRSLFLERLKAEVDVTADEKAIFIKLTKFLQLLLVARFFESADFKSLIVKFRQLLHAHKRSIKGSQLTASIPDSVTMSPSVGQTNIAILLLDAENLQLDLETEKFLASICTYPIQIKVAFANWRSMGKQDSEFHGRGYELIHVPQGKDSADFKMATVGSSIFVHYPNAKEVLVCSSDNGLSHLVNTLQTHGLTVYRIRKQGDNITILNSKTGEVSERSLKPVPEIPSMPQLIIQLKALIKLEQKRTGYQWIKLSRLSNLYQTKYNLTISQVLATHLPDKKARQIFIEYPNDFVLHQLPETSHLYVTLFDVPTTPKSDNSSKDEEEKEVVDRPDDESIPINSLKDLEEALVGIFNELTVHSPSSPMYLEIIGTEFNKKYGQPINGFIKDSLKINGSLLKILQSFNSFKVEQKKGKWQVAMR